MKSILLVLVAAPLVGAAPGQTQLAEVQRLSTKGQATAAAAGDQSVLSGAQSLAPVELNGLGAQLYGLARYREAESLYRRALAGWEGSDAEAEHGRLTTSLNLGVLLRTEGRYAEAETLLRECLQRAEANFGADSLEAGRAASSLAALYQDWRKWSLAESLAIRANFIFYANVSVSAGDRANNRRTLAAIYTAQGHYDRAEAMLRPLAEGPEDRLTAGVYNDLASLALRQNRLADAETLALTAIEVAQRTLPAAHPVHAAALSNLAQSYRFQGKFLEAERAYREAISLLDESLGPQHPETGQVVMNLAAFYHQRNRETGAEQLYRRAAGIFESAYGPADPLTLVARDELAEVLRAQGRFTESEKLARPALEGLQTALDAQDPRVVRALANYARLLEGTQRPKAAKVRTPIHETGLGFRQTP